jgi:ribose 5-phosphate isomerase A
MNLKEEAAREALKYVQSGMIVGLGTGSTAKFFVEMLGDALKKGDLKDIVGVPTSKSTEELARSLGIPLSSVEDHGVLDVAVDGADEVDPALNLIKGLGKALLREKIVEVHAKHFVVVVDDSKMVQKLGTKGPLPVEIVPFAAKAHVRWLNTLEGCTAELWVEDGKPAMTDNGNYLAKCAFKDGIPDAYVLAKQLESRPGIVEHGLFLDMAGTVIVAEEKGVKVLKK